MDNVLGTLLDLSFVGDILTTSGGSRDNAAEIERRYLQLKLWSEGVNAQNSAVKAVVASFEALLMRLRSFGDESDGSAPVAGCSTEFIDRDAIHREISHLDAMRSHACQLFALSDRTIPNEKSSRIILSEKIIETVPQVAGAVRGNFTDQFASRTVNIQYDLREAQPRNSGNGPTVIVGIDMGLTCSGIAYAYKVDPMTVTQGAPTALDANEIKVPTAVLLNSDGTFEFGHAAEAKYSEYVMGHADGKELPGQLYKGFKSELNNGEHSDFEKVMAKSAAGAEHQVLDLVVKCLMVLKEYAIQRISDNTGLTVNPTEDVQWVIPVPAALSKLGAACLRKAAYLAGLVTAEQPDDVMFVSEPEAAALAVHLGAPQHCLLSESSRFLVLDCGGGTIDITAHGSPPWQLQASAACTVGAWGGDNVNAAFHSFLRELLGPDLYNRSEKSYELYTIGCDFDKMKILFDPSKHPASIRLIDVLDYKKQLVELAEVYNATHPDEPVLISPPLRNGFLTMSKELMLSFFEPSLKATVEATKRVMSEIPGARQIVLVGGFGSSKVLTERITAEFHLKDGVSVVLCDVNPKPQGAVVSGAVHFGLQKAWGHVLYGGDRDHDPEMYDPFYVPPAAQLHYAEEVNTGDWRGSVDPVHNGDTTPQLADLRQENRVLSAMLDQFSATVARTAAHLQLAEDEASRRSKAVLQPNGLELQSKEVSRRGTEKVAKRTAEGTDASVQRTEELQEDSSVKLLAKGERVYADLLLLEDYCESLAERLAIQSEADAADLDTVQGEATPFTTLVSNLSIQDIKSVSA
jgi:hypothetical protein